MQSFRIRFKISNMFSSFLFCYIDTANGLNIYIYILNSYWRAIHVSLYVQLMFDTVKSYESNLFFFPFSVIYLGNERNERIFWKKESGSIEWNLVKIRGGGESLFRKRSKS